MSSGADQNPDEAFETADGSASQAAVAALNLRVAALESHVAELSRALSAQQAPAFTAQAQPAQRFARPAVAPAVMAQPAAAIEPPPVPNAPPPPPPRQSLEDRLGSQIFNFIGMAALIIGASWALKLAFEHGLIGPVGRVIIGLAAGAGLILWSERFRRKGFGAFSYSLKAVGSGVLYLSLWAAFQIYHLLPPGVAFGAMVLVTAWNAFMAWSQDAELLAAYALAGGFVTPLLLSTGGNHETFLFLYLASIDAAGALLIRWKPWRRLLLPAYVATVVYFIGWYSRFFHRGTAIGWDSQSAETTLFVFIFFIIFAVVSLRGWTVYREKDAAGGGVVSAVLIPLGTAAFLGLALYSVFQDSGLHGSLAWLMLGLAAMYLGLTRVQASALASAMHLAMAVVFLTIAIPLKASGHTLTTAWLVEGLVVYWAATRMNAETAAPGRVLRLLSAAGYALGLGALMFDWFWPAGSSQAGFFNANLGSAMVAVGALAGAAWLATRFEEGVVDRVPLMAGLIAIDLVALLLTLRQLKSAGWYGRPHPAFANADFVTALLGLAILAAASWSAYWLARMHPVRLDACATFAGGTLVAFNLLAILVMVREIGALWQSGGVGFGIQAASNANVQRSLAVSAFLMVYGAVLLAAGFWRRSAFVRWQALLLLIFTILKVFLYDVSGLSQGYRVASFLGLGALLMAVSFAYQKDWLGLKAASPGRLPEEPV